MAVSCLVWAAIERQYQILFKRIVWKQRVKKLSESERGVVSKLIVRHFLSWPVACFISKKSVINIIFSQNIYARRMICVWTIVVKLSNLYKAILMAISLVIDIIDVFEYELK